MVSVLLMLNLKASGGAYNPVTILSYLQSLFTVPSEDATPEWLESRKKQVREEIARLRTEQQNEQILQEIKQLESVLKDIQETRHDWRSIDDNFVAAFYDGIIPRGKELYYRGANVNAAALGYNVIKMYF